MITIIEGPDGSGKTTLARSDAFSDMHYYHQGPYTGDVTRQTVEAIVGAEKPALFDRLHIGERVYGPLLRGQDALGHHGQMILDDLVTRWYGVLILALPSRDTVLRNWRRRAAAGQEMLDDEGLMVKSYDAWLSVRSIIPTIIYDYEAHSPESVRDRVEEVRRVMYGN